VVSISKLFTTLLVLQLVDEGRLTLDAPLSEAGFDGVRITPRELLTHRSGLRDGDHPDAVLVGRSSSDAGTWSYADVNFDLLGRVVERIGGEPFADIARRRVFEPLGMHDSTFDPTAPGVVDGHAGSVDGIRCLLTLWPARGRGIVVLGNAESLRRWAMRSKIVSILDAAD
jgi:CubicO group peptidase (beta-lactamase class C family)